MLIFFVKFPLTYSIIDWIKEKRGRMNMKLKKSYIVVGMAILLIGSATVFSAPGDEDDPLVTQSYINNTVDQIKVYIDQKIRAIETGTSSPDISNELKVLELNKGQYLIGSAGTEIILRGGKATAYNVAKNKGISDVTAGVDIDNSDNQLPYNHLLIIPRDDGRGAYCTDKAFFMVRGSFEVK